MTSLPRAALKRWLEEWTGLLVPWIQAIALMAAGIFALYEYHEHQQEAKIQRAADYLSRLNSGELLSARIKLSSREQKLNGRLRQVLGDTKASSDQENAAYYHFVVCDLLMHGTDQNLEDKFFLTLGFLDDGVVCSQGLCNENTIRASLGHFGQSFVRTYNPYLCYLRMIWNDRSIGRQVEAFYNPVSLQHACRDFETSLTRTGALVGKAYSCGGDASN